MKKNWRKLTHFLKFGLSKFFLTIDRKYTNISIVLGGVAQLGERLTGSQEVRGSIPLVSTKFRF